MLNEFKLGSGKLVSRVHGKKPVCHETNKYLGENSRDPTVGFRRALYNIGYISCTNPIFPQKKVVPCPKCTQ